MTIAIVGGGSWGTALAIHLGRLGRRVRLWAREPEVVEAIQQRRRNPWYVADLDVPPSVEPMGDLGAAVHGAEVVVVAVPSEYVRGTLAGLGPLSAGTPLVSATKGFDPETHARMSQIIAARFPAARIAALSGPTFAREVALGRPTACVIASADEPLALHLQQLLGSREFRLYTNRDMVGVEVGGAMKNVIAVATGIADGLGLGENARAALITRGLAEMTRLAVALGGTPGTLAGLAGVGDLVLTCTGTLSRNRALGMALAQGKSQEALERETRMVAEGARTVGSALALAAEVGVTLPISAELTAVLRDGKSPAEALASLLGRPLTREDAAEIARV
jgi:glycerol-3-phosphate dehydrogenase (NAD(P)+)